MLQTKLQPRETNDTTWAWAVKNGYSETMKGHKVLLLGQADYVYEDGMIKSVNGGYLDGSGDGIRWTCEKTERGWFVGTDIDRLAIEFFTGELVQPR